ncbi:MAG: hypothetical protein ACI9FR_000393 [Cryomorphaceae bacterium]|jgi:hypothetical protein
MIKSSTLDQFAIMLSGVCLVHCLVTPILITLLPIISMSAMVEDLVFHKLMLWLVLPTSCVALFLGCRQHKLYSIAVTGALGLGILIAVAFLGHQCFGIGGEKIATVVGGLVLAASHYLNFRACQNVSCEDRNCATEHHH